MLKDFFIFYLSIPDVDYEGYDDVYGHSVEDDFASSPSMRKFYIGVLIGQPWICTTIFSIGLEHFLYDRAQGNHQMSAYLQSDIPEEEEISELVFTIKKFINLHFIIVMIF